MSKASDNLRDHQQQLDMDGVMVGVSRQAVEEVLAELAKLREALEYISNPIVAMQKEAEDKGYRINGAMVVSIANDANHLKDIARKALLESSDE